MPISESIASRILCLPLYVGLTKEELQLIVNLINQSMIIVGASGHAKEVFDICRNNEDLFFF